MKTWWNTISTFQNYFITNTFCWWGKMIFWRSIVWNNLNFNQCEIRAELIWAAGIASVYRIVNNCHKAGINHQYFANKSPIHSILNELGDSCVTPHRRCNGVWWLKCSDSKVWNTDRQPQTSLLDVLIWKSCTNLTEAVVGPKLIICHPFLSCLQLLNHLLVRVPINILGREFGIFAKPRFKCSREIFATGAA